MSHLHISEKLTYIAQKTASNEEYIDNSYYQEYLKLSQKEYMFSDLLPMNLEKTLLNNQMQIIKVIRLLKQLYLLYIDTLIDFYLDRQVDKFDPHIGEASCQVRALQLYDLCKSITLKIATKKAEYINKLEEKIKTIDHLIYLNSISSKRLNKKMSIEVFLKLYKLDIQIENNDIFLLTSYFLTMFKKYINLESDIVDYHLISMNLNVSSTAARRLTHHLQRLNALLSVDYVYKIASDSKYNYLKYMLNKDDNNRFILPSFEISKIILKLVENKGINIILDVMKLDQASKESFWFQIIYKDGQFTEFKGCGKDKKSYSPSCLFLRVQCFIGSKASVKTKEQMLLKLKQYNLFDVILLSLSSHAQYSGYKLKRLSENPYGILKRYFNTLFIREKIHLLRYAQTQALLNGFCNANPVSLVISHISLTRIDQIKPTHVV